MGAAHSLGLDCHVWNLLYYTEDRTTDGEITTHSDLTALLRQKQYFKKTPSIFFGLQLCGFLKKIKPKLIQVCQK